MYVVGTPVQDHITLCTMAPSVWREISPEEHNLMVTKTIDLLKGSVEKKRAEILEYFHKVGTSLLKLWHLFDCKYQDMCMDAK